MTKKLKNEKPTKEKTREKKTKYKKKTETVKFFEFYCFLHFGFAHKLRVKFSLVCMI